MLPYIKEFLGTALLILIGNSCIASAVLEKTSMKGAGSVQTTMGYGLAVLIPAYIFGPDISFNPALTIALAVDGTFPWRMVPGYILAQTAGAFVGAVLVYVMYRDHYDATEDPGAILATFAASPAIPNFKQNVISEMIGTFVLVLAVKGMGNVPGLTAVMGDFLFYWVIVSIGMSLASASGGSVNPARDIGPRLAHFILPIRHKGSSNWSYALVNVIGPVAGGILAVLLFAAIPWGT